MELSKKKGAFEGTVASGGAEINGQWQQGGLSLPLVLKKVERVPELRRPQEPIKPYPYDEEEVTFENKKANVRLAGTLTRPRSPGSHPAALLISGSGPQDRNETVFSHRPFLVLADYLTRRGIAVLRVDDRGVGGSTGSTAEATSADLAGDVAAGLAFLQRRQDIDHDRIGLIGHSEGGLIAPLVAAGSQDVAFIVLLAAPGVTGEELMYLQGETILRAAGASQEAIAWHRGLQDRIFAVLKQETNAAEAKKRIGQVMAQEFAKLNGHASNAAPPQTAIQAQVERSTRPHVRFLLAYDPRPALKQVRCPVLAINGAKDCQVPAKENLGAIAEALRAGGHKGFTIKELPDLNHLLQTCRTGAISEYGHIEETIAPAALDIVGDWILRVMGEH